MGRKLNNLLPALLIIVAGCQPDANEMLEKSLQAHGGMEVYREMTGLSYRKTTILYDSIGQVESSVTQNHNYYFGTVVSGSIDWTVDSVQHKVEFSGNDVKKFIDGQIVEDPSARGLVGSSIYVLFQPFKLKDPGVSVRQENKKWLIEETSYPVLIPEFEGGSSDKWWFYLDPQNFKVIANLVEHDGRFSFIENLEFDDSTGLLLHKHRKSYFTDNLLEKKLLRAEYFYEGYFLR